MEVYRVILQMKTKYNNNNYSNNKIYCSNQIEAVNFFNFYNKECLLESFKALRAIAA